MSTKPYFCIAPRSNGIPCNYPIGLVVREDKQIDYTDNNPESPEYGRRVEECPRCGRQFQMNVSWDGSDPLKDMMLELEKEPPEPMEIIFSKRVR